MFSKYLVFVEDLCEDIEKEALHEFVGSRKAIQAVYPEYSSLDLARIVFEEIVYEKTKLFQNGVNV